MGRPEPSILRSGSANPGSIGPLSGHFRTVAFALAAAVTSLVMLAPAVDHASAVQRAKILPGFNGNVNAISEPDANGTRYLGGAFTAYNAIDSGGGAVVDPVNSVVQTRFPKVVGSIYAVAADDSGGFYIGGAITSVDGVARTNAAHINSDGSLDTGWSPSPNGTVRALAVSGSTIYMGGSFSTVGGVTRNYAAAVNSDGTVGSWNPNLDWTVNALAVSGSTVYLGGLFSTVGGVTRNYAAAVGTDGTLRSWNPNLNNSVNALAVSGSTVYLGGQFTNVGGNARNRAAAVGTDGTLGSWSPNINGTITALAVSESTVYLGGLFTIVGGNARNRAAAVGTDGTLGSWDPNVGGTVTALAVSGSTVYLGGEFTNVGGATRNYAAAIDVNGALGSWNPNLNNSVNALAVTGSTVYLGGQFTNVGGARRNNAAAIDINGALGSWSPNVGGTVTALAVSGSTVYLGGQFTNVGGATRNYAAAVNTDGTLSTWNPNLNNTANALAVSGSTVYLGGQFTNVGGATRNYAAAVNTDGTLSSWNPNVDGAVNAMAVSGSTVYLGGQFTNVATGLGNTSRNRAVAVGTNGVLYSWNPNVGGTVTALAVSGSTVYLGGQFTTVGGLSRNRIAAVSIGNDNGSVGSCVTVYTNPCLRSWNPNVNGTTNALAATGSTVYMGGTFTTVGGVARNGAAAVGTDGTLSTSWDPNLNSTVNALAVSGSTVYLGGQFTTVGGGLTTRNRAAAFGTDGTLASWGTQPAAPTLDTNPATLDRGVTVKGDFTTPNGFTPDRYQWQRCTSGNTADCANIVGGGSNGAWWGSRNSDIGNSVRLGVITQAVFGELDPVYSVLSGIFKPTATAAPVINRGLVSGVPKVGTRTGSTFGTWSGYLAGSSTVSFQWQRCSSTDPASCTTNVGTASQWYTPVAGDAGNYLRVTATITSNGQSASSSSSLTGQVAPMIFTRKRASAAKAKVSR